MFEQFRTTPSPVTQIQWVFWHEFELSMSRPPHIPTNIHTNICAGVESYLRVYYRQTQICICVYMFVGNSVYHRHGIYLHLFKYPFLCCCYFCLTKNLFFLLFSNYNWNFNFSKTKTFIIIIFIATQNVFLNGLCDLHKRT